MIAKDKMDFAIEEFDSAWQDFLEDKPEPKNDEEDKKQQEEFYHWYNFVRKKSDTGKTPAEMYKELYGEEPPQNPIDNNTKPSRIMNFGWDEEDNESDFDDEEELDEAQEEAVVIATKIFETSWKNIKQEVEGTSKKEACKYSFILGFLDYLKMMDKKAEQLENKIKGMSKEDIEKLVNDFKDQQEKI